MEETVELEYIFLENGKKYYITEEVNDYVLLVNAEDDEDFCIRKNVKHEDGKEYIESLDSYEEFDKAFLLFAKEK